MKVFVTGALGFIGRALTERYRREGATVVGMDAAADGSGGIVGGDVSEAGAWQRATAGCDLLVHTAAIVNNTAPRERCWAVNVLGTKRAVDAAARGGVPRVVHLSSVRAFSDGDFPDGVDESWPVRPDGHRYVDTKVASEQVVLQAHAEGTVAVTVIRPGDVYGPGSIPWTIWPVLGLPTGGFVLPSEGGIFSPVYVDNLVDGIMLSAGERGVGHVFTISDGVGMANEAFFGHYARMLGIELPTAPVAEVRAVLERTGVGAETADYFLRQGTYSIAKATSALGYAPAIALAEGMARTEVWLRQQKLLPAMAAPPGR